MDPISGIDPASPTFRADCVFPSWTLTGSLRVGARNHRGSCSQTEQRE